MLTHLTIENYILIKHLDFSITGGFNVITGETGAGKSILVDALGLILGERADMNVLRDKEKKCVVEGVFNTANYNLENFFENNELDYDEVVILRREISPQGKSRAFINDTPVNLPVLKELGVKLVDIHSQHETLLLNNSAFQLQLIDSYAGNADLFAEYSSQYKKYQKNLTELKELQLRNEKNESELDYHLFQLNELRELDLQAGEPEELEEEVAKLSHTEDIKVNVFKALQNLYDSNPGVIGLLNELLNSLNQISAFDPVLSQLTERIEQASIELKDVHRELEIYSDRIIFNPERLEEVNNRLSDIYSLIKKHHVLSGDELLNVKKELEAKTSGVESLRNQLEKLSENLSTQKTALFKLADQLHETRSNACVAINKEMLHVLSDLGMPDAIFTASAAKSTELTSNGIDFIAFRFSANKGGEMQSIQKVASGGELSRLMLALKSLVISKNILPTILFDEIDSGVSGDIAGKVGEIMRKISVNSQVFAITHLPQIAGKADHHFLAYKESENGTTTSSLRKLEITDRVEEIARIISNDKVSDTARNMARELISAIKN